MNVAKSQSVFSVYKIDEKMFATSTHFNKCNQIYKGSSELTANVKIEEISIDSSLLECLKAEETFEVKDVIKTNVKDQLTAHSQTHNKIKPYSHEINEQRLTTSTDVHKYQFNKKCLASELTTNVKIEDILIDLSSTEKECLKTEKTLEIKDVTKAKEKEHLTVHVKPYTCKICEKRFAHSNSFRRHLRKHTGIKLHKCEVCEKSFSNKCDLTRHLQTHTGIKPYKCEICEKQFSLNQQLKNHLQTHTGIKPYTCAKCKKQFTRQASLKLHLQIHDGIKRYNCKICEKGFTQKSDLTKHSQIHTGIKPYQCEICKRRFTQKGSLNCHLLTHTGIKPYTCEICKKQFTKERYVKQHLQTQHTYNEETFTTSADFHKNQTNIEPLLPELTTHVKTEIKIEEISIDLSSSEEEWLKTEETLDLKEDVMKTNVKDHLITHSQTHTEIKPYSHKIDEKTFTTGTDSYKHQFNKECFSPDLTMNVKIEEILVEYNPPEWIKTEDTFEIKDVAKTNVKDHLTTHSQKHTEIKPYSHKIDENTFTTSTDFYKYQFNKGILSPELTTNVKTEIKIEENSTDLCLSEEEWLKTEETCDLEEDVMKTNVKDHLSSHSQIHSEIKPYSCGTGKETFTINTDFYKHQFNNRCLSSDLTTNVKIEEIIIDSNPSKEEWFKTEETLERKEDVIKTNLKDHLTVHVKPYTCNICEKGFTAETSLKVHLRTHTGIKPYKCKVCEKNFADKSHSKRHLQTHTGIKPHKCEICKKQFARKSGLRGHLLIHTGIKQYACEICDTRFARKDSLMKHLQTHTGIKPYTCEVCEKQFTEKSNLNKHLQKHTGIKPYTCDICKKRFAEKGSLKIHLQAHNGIKSYSCHMCDKQYVRKSSLNKHLRKEKHLDSKVRTQKRKSLNLRKGPVNKST